MSLPTTVKELKVMLDNQREERIKSTRRLAETAPDLPAAVKPPPLKIPKQQRLNGFYHLTADDLIINK